MLQITTLKGGTKTGLQRESDLSLVEVPILSDYAYSQ